MNVPCQLQKTSFHVFDCYMYVLIDFGVNYKKKNCQAIRRCHISSNIGGRKILLLSEQNRAGIRETTSKEGRRILILFLLLFLLVVVVVVVVVVVFFHKFPPKEVDRVLRKVFK